MIRRLHHLSSIKLVIMFEYIEIIKNVYNQTYIYEEKSFLQKVVLHCIDKYDYANVNITLSSCITLKIMFIYLRTWWSIRYIRAVDIIYIFSDYVDKKKRIIFNRDRNYQHTSGQSVYTKENLFSMMQIMFELSDLKFNVGIPISPNF